MSHLSYRLYDRNGRRVALTNIKSAYRADFILKNKIIYSMDFPSRYKKSLKESDIDMFVSVFEEEIEAQKEITRLKRQFEREKRKELNAYKKVLLEKQKEKEQQQQLEKEIQKDLEMLLKEDKRLEKIEEKRLEKEKAIKGPTEEEIENALSDREQELIKQEKRKLRLEKAKLSRNIKGRIRLYLKEHLINKRHFWSKDKEEDFIKILERAYGKLVKDIKDRGDETNFKKFIKRVTDSLQTYDSREAPTSEDIQRMVLKRIKYEEEQEKLHLDYKLDHDKDKEFNYKQTKTDYKYYFSKKTNTNNATKRFIFDFEQPLSISPNFKRNKKTAYSQRVKDIYITLHEILLEEIRRLHKNKEIKSGKDYQIRFFIPQFDENDKIIYNYVGGNGIEKKKSGYGISLPSKPFNIKEVDSDIDELFDLMRERIANYLSRNIGLIDSQYITGFMIITGV